MNDVISMILILLGSLFNRVEWNKFDIIMFKRIFISFTLSILDTDSLRSRIEQ